VATDALTRLDALAETALKLAGTAPSGRLALARAADALEAEWLPEPWRSRLAPELEAAREAMCVPLGFRDVEKTLRELDLDDVERDPVAVTPIAQVHRGELDGAAVAVKVLRPNIARGVRQDLQLLDALLVPLNAAFPALDARAMVRELSERVLEELDLEHEAQMQRRFYRALRDHERFVVPRPHTALARHDVLVSDWVDGTPVRDAPDRDAAAALLLRFTLGAARSLGTIDADPHLDDALVLEDGRLAVLDFGATRTLEPGRVDEMLAAVDAFADGDEAAFGAALERLGHLPADAAPAALRLAVHAGGELVTPGPSRLDSAAVCAARDRLIERPDDLAEVLTRGALPPADLWPARGASQLFGVIARIGATGDWVALSREALREGWG
jgi:hypothetical protein